MYRYIQLQSDTFGCIRSGIHLDAFRRFLHDWDSLMDFFGFNIKNTMNIAQKLYEGGHITYMRTDSKKYSSKFIKDVSSFIVSTYGKKYVSSSIKRLSNNVKSKKENGKK